MWDWIIVLLVGALCGWLASKLMGTDAQQGAAANILIGIAGALLAKFVFSDMLHWGGAQAAGSNFSFWSILWGIVGSSVVIALLKALGVLR
ncbi:GlsB/YeaQ/YmgE family stress response membrane protein [Deinococcus lacus]|uniref:GlsB/YeaQ/YmgE family stress response membrane protein n=1 Tax=Deinococcus lacus TaxID=392561 RepID=A0ABW1YBJ7_9DEIO